MGTLAEGDAPSSPELTVGADGDAVDWNVSLSVTYGRRGEYDSRLARRRGKGEMERYWDGHRLLDRDRGSGTFFTLGERVY